MIAGLSCLIKVVATDPLGALTMVALGVATGGSARAGRLAREAGLPGLQDQEMGCAGTLLVAAGTGEAILLINLLLVYVL